MQKVKIMALFVFLAIGVLAVQAYAEKGDMQPQAMSSEGVLLLARGTNSGHGSMNSGPGSMNSGRGNFEDRGNIGDDRFQNLNADRLDDDLDEDIEDDRGLGEAALDDAVTADGAAANKAKARIEAQAKAMGLDDDLAKANAAHMLDFVGDKEDADDEAPAQGAVAEPAMQREVRI